MTFPAHSRWPFERDALSGGCVRPRKPLLRRHALWRYPPYGPDSPHQSRPDPRGRHPITMTRPDIQNPRRLTAPADRTLTPPRPAGRKGGPDLIRGRIDAIATLTRDGVTGTTDGQGRSDDSAPGPMPGDDPAYQWVRGLATRARPTEHCGPWSGGIRALVRDALAGSSGTYVRNQDMGETECRGMSPALIGSRGLNAGSHRLAGWDGSGKRSIDGSATATV